MSYLNRSCSNTFFAKEIKLRSVLFASLMLSFYISVAQVPSIKWWYNTRDASLGQSAAADIDGDGKLEVVFGCYRNDSNVYALNAENGSLLWKYNTHPNGAEGCNDVASVLYDTDKDGKLDVIVPSSCNPVTYCFNGQTGAVKWKCNTRGSDSPPTIADLDGDGKQEILHGEFGGYVLCINAEDGTKAWELKVDTNSWIQTAPTITDLNNDGKPDFIVGTWNFSHQDSVYAYRGDTRAKLWSFPIYNYTYHGTAVGDIDNDGKPELLIGSYKDTLYCLNGENGTVQWKYYGGGGYIGAPASIGDVDNDGSCDIVFVSGYKVTALTKNGILKWSYNIPKYGGAFRGVALADINNDAFPEVIFGDDKGVLSALRGNNGTLLWSLDLALHYGNTKFELSHAPLVADFNKDDTLDIFIVGGHAEYPAFNNNFGRAYMVSAGKGKGPEWLMFQRDIRRQSSLCTFAMTSAENTLEWEHSVALVYPNPAKQLITVTLPFEKNIKTLNIFDSKGNQTLIMEYNTGNIVTINTENLGIGIYFLRIQTQDGLFLQQKFLIE